MKIKHCFYTCMLSILLAVTLCVPAAAFSVEPEGWAAEQCRHLQDDGLLNWDIYTDSIAPNNAIRRGDFCHLLVNLIQMEGEWNKIQVVKPAEVGYFDDLGDADSGTGYAMHYGVAYGITNGSNENGRCLADARSNLTREQAAKMMCTLFDALETYGGVPAPSEGEGRTYTDQADISGWAVEYVARASALGILQGNSDGRFNPKGNLTWQEACVMVDRAYRTAQESVKVHKSEQGIQLNSTAMDISAAHYLQGSENLYALEYNGQKSVLSIGNEGVLLESYNADGTSASIKTIPMELEKCGGFCEGADNYYLAFGQDNMEESGSKTVFRIVKYDKNWNRQGAADISDCYTTEPFRHTSHTAMAEEDGTLVFHTARLRYLTTDDNLRHQSNFTAKIRTLDMSVLSQSEVFPKNHVSHSFAQYVAFDNGLPVYIDHGDAYPRGFTLNAENAQGTCKEQNFFSFSGAIGDNTTNAVPGGMGISANNYLFLGASSPQQGNDSLKRTNVFLSVIPKASGQAQTRWLTSYPADEQEYVNNLWFVPVNNNTFVAMWQSTRPGKNFYTYGDFQYAVFDGQGQQIGETKSLPGYVIPCGDPSVYGNRIIWAQPELDVSQRYSVRKSRYMQIFELEIDSGGGTAQKPQTGTGSDTSADPSTPDKPGTSGGSDTPGKFDNVDLSVSPDYPTRTDEVNGMSITRTDIEDGGKTMYYREDWGNGNFMVVSLEDSVLQFSVCNMEGNHTRGILAAGQAVSKTEFFVTPGTPATAISAVDSSKLQDGKRLNVSVGTAADGESAYTTFRSGVGVEIGLDENGKPALWVKLPFWLK